MADHPNSQFVTIRPAFAFIRAEGDDGNLYVSGAALAALPHMPRRRDPVRFRVAETRDGRRRAIDLVLMEREVADETPQSNARQISA